MPKLPPFAEHLNNRSTAHGALVLETCRLAQRVPPGTLSQPSVNQLRQREAGKCEPLKAAFAAESSKTAAVLGESRSSAVLRRQKVTPQPRLTILLHECIYTQ